MTIHLTFSLQWVLLCLTVVFALVPFWTMSWSKYNDNWGGPFMWCIHWLWMWGCAIVLGVWALTEFFR